jgi:hypothetical protein
VGNIINGNGFCSVAQHLAAARYIIQRHIYPVAAAYGWYEEEMSAL